MSPQMLPRKKNLCICIRYFSEQEMQVATAFVGMIEVVGATGENSFQAVKTGLQTVGLDLHNCFGFASDGASTMVQDSGIVAKLYTDEMYLSFTGFVCPTCIREDASESWLSSEGNTEVVFEKHFTKRGFPPAHRRHESK
eukprot:gene17047-8560_t